MPPFGRRDTQTIECHAAALVRLLESCLQHDLKPSDRDEDPPHAKMASDVLACLFKVSKAPDRWPGVSEYSAGLSVSGEQGAGSVTGC